MPGQYLYNVEFTVDDYDFWWYPEDVQNPDDVPVSIRFEMPPSVKLEIDEDEFVDQVNCDKKITKSEMFTLSEQQVTKDLEGKLLAVVSQCPGNEELIGHYKLGDLYCVIKRLIEKFDEQSDLKSGVNSDICATVPTYETIRELVQLVNEKNLPSGTVYYTLRVTCFGPTFSPNKMKEFEGKEAKLQREELNCLDPSPCPPKPSPIDPEYNEYAAEVNGNQLIIRVHKNDTSHLVTRVYDHDMNQKGCEINKDPNLVSICGCDQQVDFKFPGNFSCGDGKNNDCDCGGNSMLTDHQKKTSCAGRSFKNSCKLPVIRGNLKYPGKLDGFVKMNVYDQCFPPDSTPDYIKQPLKSRGACCQADSSNRERDGKCKIRNGIQVCQKGCADPDFDVFILKLGSKRKNKHGVKNEIELEMRTPKGPDNEVKKMETREAQVTEKEFEDEEKPKKSGEKSEKSDQKPKSAKAAPKKKK